MGRLQNERACGANVDGECGCDVWEWEGCAATVAFDGWVWLSRVLCFFWWTIPGARVEKFGLGLGDGRGEIYFDSGRRLGIFILFYFNQIYCAASSWCTLSIGGKVGWKSRQILKKKNMDNAQPVWTLDKYSRNQVFSGIVGGPLLTVFELHSTYRSTTNDF